MPKTQLEQLEQAERQAQEALRKMPEPPTTYAAAESPEGQAAAVAKEEAVLASTEDKRSDRSDREELDQLEHRMLELQKHIAELRGSQPLLFLAPADMPKQPPKSLTQEELNKTVTIYIMPESPERAGAVPIVVNDSYRAILPRGVNIKVPFFVTKVLDDAVIDTHEYPIENNMHMARKIDFTPMTLTPVERAVHKIIKRYPYMIVQM